MKIKWDTTIWVNFLRSFFAGIVYTIVMLAAGESTGAIMLLFPAIYFVIILPLAMALGKICEYRGSLVCLFMPILMLTVIVGDPFVFILKMIKPELVPVEGYKIVNFRAIVKVYK